MSVPQAAENKEAIARALEDARRRTVDLLAPISDDDLVHPHSSIMSPLVWDLAHIGYFEELWLLREIAGLGPLREDADDLYDAFQHGRSERPSLPLLSPADAHAYLAEVRARTEEMLRTIELDPSQRLLANGFVYGLVVQHELQHHETMLQTIQLAGIKHPGGRPARVEGAGGMERVEAGPFVMGTDSEPWAYDNERPAHKVEVPAFAIDRAPVTNAAYAEYLADTGVELPETWRREGEGSWSRLCFGRRETLVPEEPVQHVSWHEAEAYADWAGKRLPAEAEWEKAASLGLLDGVGEVWEWTTSDFGAYPGFEAFPYREYSEVFFGSDSKVLRGGSWATSPLVGRLTFRNWDFPIRSQLFAGLRCAADV